MVSHYRCEGYDLSKIQEAIKKIIDDCGGIDRLLSKGKRVVIKPNLVMKKSPEYAATTHPVVVEALIKILKEHTDDITLTECSGGPNNAVLMQGTYKTTGMEEVCHRYGVKLNYDFSIVKRRCPNTRAAFDYECQKIYSECDVFINVAKLKSHSLTLVSGAPKNLYGTIPGLKKTEYHSRFPDMDSFSRFILDINEALVPDLNIVDAIDIMEGNGPTAGTRRHLGSILGGNNAFEIDVASCKLLGVDYKNAPIPAAAVREGLCAQDPQIIGDSIEALDKFVLPDTKYFSLLSLFLKGNLKKFAEPRPAVNSKKCVGCMKCAEVCPRSAITKGKDKKIAEINYDVCIKCFCCHELCPMTAIKIKRNPIMNF